MNKSLPKVIVPIFLILLPVLVFAENFQKPWDFLRPLADTATSIDSITKIIVFFFSAILLAIALLAYLKVKSQKLLIVAGAFFLFFFKWLLIVLDIFLSDGNFFPLAAQNVAELLVFIALFLAIFKK